MVLSGVRRKKSLVTPPGIDPGTVRLVVQRLLYLYKEGILMIILITVYKSISKYSYIMAYLGE